MADFAGSLERGFNTGMKLGRAMQDRRIREAQREGLAAAQAKADASGGEKVTGVSNVDGLEDGETADSVNENTRNLMGGLSQEEVNLAKAQLAREETDGWVAGQKGAPGLQPRPAQVPQAFGPQAPETPGTSIERKAPGAYTVATPATTTPYAASDEVGTEQALRRSRLLTNQETRNAPESTPAAGLKPKMTLDTIRGPKLDVMDIYRKEAVPNILKKMIEQGRMEDAQKFETWAESGAGKSYTKSWVDGRMKIAQGDHVGALKAAEEIYNKQVPDGQIAIVKPGDKEGLWVVEVRDEKTNKVISKREDSVENWNIHVYGAGDPSVAFKHMTDLEATKAANARADAAATLAHERAKELAVTKAGLEPKGTSQQQNAQALVALKQKVRDAKTPQERAAAQEHLAAFEKMNTSSFAALAGLALRQQTVGMAQEDRLDKKAKDATASEATIQFGKDAQAALAKGTKMLHGMEMPLNSAERKALLEEIKKANLLGAKIPIPKP
jgi:hypothetical protein